MLIRGPAVRGVLLPGVFRPRSDTWLLARAACGEPLEPDAQILELCAGPGLAGISAAGFHGAALTTVDVSQRAAVNAAINGRLNRVPIRARRGDLLDAVGDDRFDMILANPPYVPGPAPSAHGPARAWDAGSDGRAVLDRICVEAPGHLNPGGVLLLVQSEVSHPNATLEAYTAGGLIADVAAAQQGPLGPLLQGRRQQLEAHGLLQPGQTVETVFVVRGRRPRHEPDCRPEHGHGLASGPVSN
jgi:release factor glutamine methyltransferase